VVGGSQGYVYALNATNGLNLWKYSTDSGDSSPAVVNGIIYVGSGNGEIYALGSSPASSNIVFIIVGVVAVVVIVAAVVVLIFRKRRRTKIISPQSTS
jgi:LPXTG-motif cell wall-anchored protein